VGEGAWVWLKPNDLFDQFLTTIHQTKQETFSKLHWAAPFLQDKTSVGPNQCESLPLVMANMGHSRFLTCDGHLLSGGCLSFSERPSLLLCIFVQNIGNSMDVAIIKHVYILENGERTSLLLLTEKLVCEHGASHGLSTRGLFAALTSPTRQPGTANRSAIRVIPLLDTVGPPIPTQTHKKAHSCARKKAESPSVSPSVGNWDLACELSVSYSRSQTAARFDTSCSSRFIHFYLVSSSCAWIRI
jgi:hypothetical protein